MILIITPICYSFLYMEDKSLFFNDSSDETTLSEIGFADEYTSGLYCAFTGDIGNIAIEALDGSREQENPESVYLNYCGREAEMLERPFDENAKDQLRKKVQTHLCSGKYLVLVLVDKQTEAGHMNLQEFEKRIGWLDKARKAENESKRNAPTEKIEIRGGKRVKRISVNWDALGK